MMYKIDGLWIAPGPYVVHITTPTTRAHALRVLQDQWLLDFFFGSSAGPHQSDAPIIIALDSTIPPLMSYSSVFW